MKRHELGLLAPCAVLLACSGGGQPGPTPVATAATDAGATVDAAPTRPAETPTCRTYCARAAAVGCPEVTQAECLAACESIESDAPCFAQMQEQVACGSAKPAEQWSCDASGEATAGCSGEAALGDCLVDAYAMCGNGALVLADWWCDGQVDCADGSDEVC